MSIFQAFMPAVLPDQSVWFGTITTQAPNLIVITAADRVVFYNGTFTYPSGGGVTGTLDGIQEFRGANLFYRVDQIGADASAMFEAIQVNADFEAAARLVTQGNDTLTGSVGADEFYGLLGDDRLFGGAGNDSIFGGDGADYLDGNSGADTMGGGLGNDFYIVDNALDVVTDEVAYSAGGGIDTVRAFVDYVQPDNIELVRLEDYDGTSNLNATGNDAPGTLVGNAGNNVLIGRGGNDQLNGNDGNDTITGNTGRDTLVGGNGADTFVLTAYADSRAGSANRDVINGFDRGADRIDLSQLDANTRTFGTDDAFEFIGFARFSGDGASSAGELRLQSLGGPNAVLIEADHNGDGVADLQVFVNLTTTLAAGDFIL